MTQEKQSVELSLFEKIGGAPAVVAMVNEFYEKVIKDPELNRYFKDVELGKLRRMQFEFFSAALGGAVQYTGRPIVNAHHHLKIALSDYQRFVHHMMDVLAVYPFTEQDRYDINGRLNMYASDVVSAGLGIIG
jgi:hemoglobin